MEKSMAEERPASNLPRRLNVLFYSRTMSIGMLILGCVLNLCNLLPVLSPNAPRAVLDLLFGFLIALLGGMVVWYITVSRRKLTVPMLGRRMYYVVEALSVIVIAWFFAYNLNFIPTAWIGDWCYAAFGGTVAVSMLILLFTPFKSR